MTSRAFGFELTGDVTLPGTTTSDAPPPPGRPLRFRQATRADVGADWTGRTTHVARARAGGRTHARIVRNDAGDLLFRANGIGLFDLRADLSLMRYAPVQRPLVPWSRYVVAQVLPFAALLAGREVLHAGAVALDGGAVAITAPSTGGKSTLLAALVQRGAPLVADDVVAVERAGHELTVHPGPALLSLRETASELLGGPAALAALGPEVAEVLGSSWREVRGHGEPLPLRALVLLERSPNADVTDVRRLAAPDPRLLLGATFNAAWQEPGRMTRLLDLIAALADTVPVYLLSAPSTASPASLAERVEATTRLLP